MSILRSLSFFLVLLFLSGCGVKSIYLQGDLGHDEFIRRAEKANSQVFCTYKGKVGVTFVSQTGAGGFTGILRKTCDDIINLSIFGPFNAIFADIEYRSGSVTVKASDPETEENIKSFARQSIDGFISYMRYPLYLPEEKGKVGIEGDFYVYDSGYDKNNVLIYFNEFFRIVGYEVDENGTSLRISYSFSDSGQVSEIKLKKGDDNVALKLLNPAGWSVLEEQP